MKPTWVILLYVQDDFCNFPLNAHLHPAFCTFANFKYLQNKTFSFARRRNFTEIWGGEGKGKFHQLVSLLAISILEIFAGKFSMAEAFEYFRQLRHVPGTVNEQPMKNANDEAAHRRITETSSESKWLDVECSKVTNEEEQRVLSFRATFRYSVNRRKKRGSRRKRRRRRRKNRRDREFGVSRTEVRPPMQSRGWLYTCPWRYSSVTREHFKSSQNFASVPHAYPRERERERSTLVARCKCVCNGRRVHVYVCYRRPDFGRLPAPILYIRAVERHYIWSGHRTRVRLLQWRMRESRAYPWHPTYPSEHTTAQKSYNSCYTYSWKAEWFCRTKCSVF